MPISTHHATSVLLVGEADMQLASERATNRNVDLLVLNRAPAVVRDASVSVSPKI